MLTLLAPCNLRIGCGTAPISGEERVEIRERWVDVFVEIELVSVRVFDNDVRKFVVFECTHMVVYLDE